MNDLGQNGLSHAEVLELLCSDRGLRDMRFHVEVLSGGVVLGELAYTGCMLECDADAEVKHYGRITARCDERFDLRKHTLRPVMRLQSGGVDFSFPFVELYPVTVTQRIQQGISWWDIEAYDRTVRLQENALGSVPYFPKGTLYTAAIATLLDMAGAGTVDLEPCGLVMETDREDWTEEQGILTVVNELLAEIGYGSLAADLDGVLCARSHADIQSAAEVRYTAGSRSVVHLDKTVENDGYKRPNRFVGVVVNPELEEPLRYEFVNSDPSLPTSTANTGYVRTEVLRYDNVADMQTLQDNVLRRAQEVARAYEYVNLRTAILPHHGVRETVAVRAQGVEGIYEETGWSIDHFGAGGGMEHRLRKVVYE